MCSQRGQAHARRALARLVGGLPRGTHRAPELGNSVERAVRRDAERRAAEGDVLECEGEEHVASEQHRGLVEGDVVSGAAAAERVVVPSRHVIVDEHARGGSSWRRRQVRSPRPRRRRRARMPRWPTRGGRACCRRGRSSAWTCRGARGSARGATEPRPTRRAQPWPWQTVLLHREADCNILQKQHRDCPTLYWYLLLHASYWTQSSY
uniref:Uncharacterized protein n=1 Tax=Arundo donax TaxID=35708 RepID=A0A0A8YXF1_ARUDO